MNTQSDRLPIGLAQSVTRRQAFKTFGLGLAGMALMRLGLREAQAITNGQLDGAAHSNVGGFVWPKSFWPQATAPLVTGSGVLIHPRVVLTAGHGTHLVEGLIAGDLMTLDDLLISFASDASNPGTWRSISGILTLPAYVANPSNGSDIGVTILNEPVTGISPVPLPPVGLLDALNAARELKAGSDRTKFTVVGYGIDPGNANFGHLPFPPDGRRRLAQAEFRNLHDQWLFTDQNDSHDNGGTCTGDSGGPLFYADPVTGQETLVAIVTRGSLNVSQHSRVDTEEALGFLNDVIARVEAGDL